DVISKVVCAMCKKCLISVNHDKCLFNSVNAKKSCGKNQNAKVSVKEIQTKYQPKVSKPKQVGTRESLTTPKPRKPRLLLRWSPTGRLFDQEGQIVDSSESKSKFDCFNGDNACTSNTMEPKIKRFPNSTSLLDRLFRFVYGMVRFGNDHVAAILGFGDLQWGNILITRVYFVEGLAKFVGDFKSLANEANASLAKHKALELEIERLLKVVVSQDIMIIVQNESVGDTSDLQTELERTKERFEICIIKKETEYDKLWNDWYKKCDECKYDKISYGKAYKDMQQKIEGLQAQLGDLKDKCKDTSCVSDTQNPLS
nr:hypothetical protein [Tanacetum cinerariifolium]